MTRSDDLTGLLLPPDPTSPFRQGVVISYNSLTGRNQILIGGNTVADGAVLEDLPILNIGDTINLLPNDVVVLIKYLNSWAIMGRVITPGGAALNSSAIAFGGTNPSASGTGLTFTNTSFATKVTGTVLVPAWANRASVIATIVINAQNNGAASNQVYARLLIDGSAGAGPFSQTVPLGGSYGFVAAHATRNGFVVTPGGSFDIEGQTQVSTSFGAGGAANLMQVDSFVIFSKA